MDINDVNYLREKIVKCIRDNSADGNVLSINKIVEKALDELVELMGYRDSDITSPKLTACLVCTALGFNVWYLFNTNTIKTEMCVCLSKEQLEEDGDNNRTVWQVLEDTW